MVEVFLENRSTWLAVLFTVHRRNEGGTMKVFFVLRIHTFWLRVMEAGRPSWRDLMVACSICITGFCGYISTIIDSSMAMILWGRLKEHRNYQ